MCLCFVFCLFVFVGGRFLFLFLFFVGVFFFCVGFKKNPRIHKLYNNFVMTTQVCAKISSSNTKVNVSHLFTN